MIETVITTTIFADELHPLLTEWRTGIQPELAGFYQVIEPGEGELRHDERRLRVAHWNGLRWSQTISPRQLEGIVDVGEWYVRHRHYNACQDYPWRALRTPAARWAMRDMWGMAAEKAGAISRASRFTRPYLLP